MPPPSTINQPGLVVQTPEPCHVQTPEPGLD
jgi:hypothetical protein